MKITTIKTTTVTLPIEAPLRHSYGVHSGFTRTLVELTTDTGLVGLGETSPDAAGMISHMEPLLIGEDPFNLERIRMKISQYGYFSRQAMVIAPIEMACFDLQGKYCGLPVYKLLGGKIREEVPMSAYLFYRYPNKKGYGEITTAEQMVKETIKLVKKNGFNVLKLKGGVFAPEYEMNTLAAIRENFDRSQYQLRFDPNACWQTETAIRIGIQMEKFDLEYYEDPAWGINGMAHVRNRVRIPLSTNMCIREFDHFAPGINAQAIDVLLADLWYWGGLLNVKNVAKMCQTFGIGLGMHSGLELGVGLAAMLHLAVSIPNLTHAMDSHYHHLTDDIIKGSMIQYKDGSMMPPQGVGLGVELDKEKVAHYAEVYAHSGKDTVLPDPQNPEWLSIIPRW